MNRKTLVVIGATCKLGRELCEIYAQENYDLLLISRNEDRNKDLKNNLKLKFKNIDINHLELDILDISKHEEIYKKITIIPSGVISLIGLTHSVKDIKDDRMLEVINTNFTYLVNFLTLFLKDFEKEKNGFLICVSSVAGLRGRAKNFFYGSAKSALNEFLSGCRNYYGKTNIHIMTVLPGFINNENTNSKKLFSIEASKLAKKIFNAQKSKNEVIYSSFVWKIIMLILNLLPNKIFKKIKF